MINSQACSISLFISPWLNTQPKQPRTESHLLHLVAIILEIASIIISSPENKLSDLKRITVKNPFTDTFKKNKTENKSIHIDKNLFEIVKSLFKDTQNLNDVDLTR